MQGSKGYQISHLVRPSAFLYPTVWMNASSGTDGMWLPTFWARSRFQPTASSAEKLNAGLQVQLPSTWRNLHSSKSFTILQFSIRTSRCMLEAKSFLCARLVLRQQ